MQKINPYSKQHRRDYRSGIFRVETM